MKRSESDGTDLNVTQVNLNKFLVTLLAFCLYLSPAMASEIHLYSTADPFVKQGLIISNNQKIAVSTVIDNNLITGYFTETSTQSVNDGTGNLIDSVNDGTGSAIDSVNDGTGSAVDSVNDGTGSALDSVNDGTGSALDSVNDGTGSVINSVNDGTGLTMNDLQNAVFQIDLNTCQTMDIELKNQVYLVQVSEINLDNQGVSCN